jgi:1-phosphofructokinase
VTVQVAVFAPAPQLTITVEQRRDRPDIHLHPGGQSVWQARMIAALGVPVVLCTVLGGEVGQVLAALLPREGMRVRAVKAQSRNGAYVHDRRGGARVDVASTAGDPLTRHELDELFSLMLAEGLRANVCLLGGPSEDPVVGPDPYRRLATDLGRHGPAVVADLSGDHLSATLDGRPRLVKVSHEEVVASGWAARDNRDDLVEALHSLHRAGAQSIVVSRAADPALALLDEIIYEVVTPTLEPVDQRGAGDSMTAAMAAGMAQGLDLPSAVRMGAAAGALNVTRHGLGTGNADAVAVLADRVQLRAIA